MCGRTTYGWMPLSVFIGVRSRVRVGSVVTVAFAAVVIVVFLFMLFFVILLCKW